MAYLKHVPSNGHEGKIVYNGGILNGIVLLAIEEIEGADIATIKSKFGTKKSIKTKLDKDGTVSVSVFVNIHCNASVSDIAFKLQENIKHNIEAMTEYHVKNVDINVEGIIFDEDNAFNS